MTQNSTAPIIGIDRGASFTDFAVVDSDGLSEIFSIESRSWHRIRTAYEGLITKYQTRHIVFSGSATGMPTSMKNIINIIAAIISSWSARLPKTGLSAGC